MGITSLRKYHNKGTNNITKYEDIAPAKSKEKPVKKVRAKKATIKQVEK